MVPIHLPLILLFFHLQLQSQVCFVSITKFHLLLPLAVLEFFGFSFCHLLEHELLVALCSFIIVALSLIIAQLLVFQIISFLVIFKLHEVFSAGDVV